MLRLIYTSVQSPGFCRLDFELLCFHSAKTNLVKGISGLLLCNDHEFMQCMEGPTSAVLEVYKKIVKDPRHSDIRLLVSESTRVRLFKTWSMLGLAITPETMLSAKPNAYTLLDHRLLRPWKSLGIGASDLIYEYALVKAELEKAGEAPSLSKVFDVYQP